MSSSSSPPPNAEFKAANAAANDPEGWRCDGCFCRNKKEDVICVVCEAPNPNLSAEDIERLKKQKEEEKNKLISMFHTNDDNNSTAPKPTGFGVSAEAAPPSATTFTFGQPQTTTSPEAGKPFVFGAPTANDAADSSNAQTISPPSATPSFVFGAPSTTSAGSSANTTPITFGSAPAAAAAPAGSGFVPKLGDDKKSDEKFKELSDKPDLDNGDLLHLGAVYVHGSGECEQLGLGDAVLERRKPTSIDKICMSTLGYKITVTQIAVGALHTLALDATSGKVFSWGCNDDGALGRLGPENQPRSIDGMEGVAVRSIAAGDNHSTFLDDLGRVWLCGTYKDSAGYLGFPNFIKGMSAEPLKRSYDPVRVPGLGTSTSRAVAIASGANHTVVAVESSRGGRSSTAAKSRILEVYAWGNDEFGQLGHGGSGDENLTEEEAVLLKHTRRAKRATSYKLHPHPLSWNKKERGPLDRVYATANCTFLVTEEGKVFGCGLNNFAQLGLGKTTAEPIRYPVEISSLASDTLGSPVKEIVGGSFHTVASTKAGEVFTWGRRDYSGLGGGSEDVTTPTKLKLTNITHVAAGGSHALACTTSGDFYTWGFGETHQLGNCPRDISKGATSSTDATDELSPYLVQSKQLESKFVLQVGGGSQHSVELAWTGSSVEREGHMAQSVKTAARRIKAGEIKDVWLGADDLLGREVMLDDGTEGKITSKEKMKDDSDPKHVYHRWFYIVTIPPSEPLGAAAAEPAPKRRRTASGRPSSASSVSSMGEGGSHKASTRVLRAKEAKEAVERKE